MTRTATADAVGPTTGGGSWVLGICMGLSNVLGYGFVLIVSRALGPADFGAFSAVNNLSLFLALPASAFQVVVAAHQARGQTYRSGIGLALGVGGALAAVAVLVSPLVASALHLGSTLPVVLVAFMLPAFMLTGAGQGLLLGHRRLAALAVVYLSMALARVAAALVALLLDSDVTGVFAWMLVSAWLPAGLVLTVAARHVRSWRSFEGGLVRELLTSNGTLAVLLAMTSTDILLARHFLDAHASGAYAFAGLFGKVVFWGTQFVALATVPSASVVTRSRGPVIRALALVVVLGLGVTLVVLAVPELLVRVMGGAEYLDSASLLVPFAVLGTLWALCQVLLFAEMAQGHHALTVVALVATAVCVTVAWAWTHTSAFGLLGTYAGTAAAVALVGTARFLTMREEPGGQGAA